MRLIDEIEAAAKRCRETGWNGFRPELDALSITTSKWWPALKAALLAGEEMRQLLWDARAPQTASPEMWLSLRTLADNRFRAATEGENAAAIWRAS